MPLATEYRMHLLHLAVQSRMLKNTSEQHEFVFAPGQIRMRNSLLPSPAQTVRLALLLAGCRARFLPASCTVIIAASFLAACASKVDIAVRTAINEASSADASL